MDGSKQWIKHWFRVWLVDWFECALHMITQKHVDKYGPSFLGWQAISIGQKWLHFGITQLLSGKYALPNTILVEAFYVADIVNCCVLRLCRIIIFIFNLKKKINAQGISNTEGEETRN